ncbi:MAG: chorismate mutase / prephenate dehydratase [Parcubacteria bacterium C7867-004]|nr:MAG: chorismate mutase / prephenate dehydratase [Parcubacteria bacterium C7867-004]
MKIGIMGAEGSFSEEAARTYMAKEGIDAEIVFLISAERVLTALEANEIDLGIFPIENSNGGIVIEAVHAMAKHRFQVKKMFEIDVHQNLMAKKGVNPEQITAITSHDQALKQCRMYLKRKWPGVEIEEYADTAKAAADIANGTLSETTAAIASRRAAEIYGLDIIEESIQDLKFNYTSFVVAERIA